MMTGTSGRNALALGKSSRPLIPGMLMSERIKMSDTPAASMMRWSAIGADWANSIVRAEIAPELLAKQYFDIRLIINYENKQAHSHPPALAADREVDQTYHQHCLAAVRAINGKDAAAPPAPLTGPVPRAKYQSRTESGVPNITARRAAHCVRLKSLIDETRLLHPFIVDAIARIFFRWDEASRSGPGVTLDRQKQTQPLAAERSEIR